MLSRVTGWPIPVYSNTALSNPANAKHTTATVFTIFFAIFFFYCCYHFCVTFSFWGFCLANFFARFHGFKFSSTIRTIFRCAFLQILLYLRSPYFQNTTATYHEWCYTLFSLLNFLQSALYHFSCPMVGNTSPVISFSV